MIDDDRTGTASATIARSSATLTVLPDMLEAAQGDVGGQMVVCWVVLASSKPSKASVD